MNTILLDRIKCVQMDVPSQADKISIATTHLIPRSLKSSGLKDDDIILADEALSYIVERSSQPGVRQIQKDISHIIRSVGLDNALGVGNTAFPHVCDGKRVKKILADCPVDDQVTRPSLMYT